MKSFFTGLALWLAVTASASAQETEPDVSTPQGALEVFLKEDRDPRSFPRRWLFMQEQGSAYGTPSPLVFERSAFENFGWFQSADPEAVRLYYQMNPKLRDEAEIEPEVLRQRLLLFMNITFSDALLLRNKDGSWSVNSRLGQELSEIGHFEKGPESLRGDAPARWLVEQLGYDALVVGADENYLFLAKLRPVKIGSQGLIMKATTNSLILKDTKEVGALLRAVHENGDFIVAKLSLTKSGRQKVPTGAKVLFSE